MTQCFSSSRVLECHVKNCLAINYTNSVLLPLENKYVSFQSFKRLIKALFITNFNFEFILIPLTDNTGFGPNTRKYHDHIVCSYSYKLICVDDRYNKLNKTYFCDEGIGKC